MNTRKISAIGTAGIQLVSLIASLMVIALLSAPTPRTTHASGAVSPPTTIEVPVDYYVIADVEPEPLEEVSLPIPECEWTPEARERLTHMVLIESSSGRDAKAIAWTMSRRWLAIARHRGETFAEYVASTSAPLRRYTAARDRGLEPEQAAVHAGLSRHQTYVVTDRLDEAEFVTATLDAWARGDVPDPCDGKTFMWRAPSFRSSSTAMQIDCGDTANHFYSLPLRTHDIYAARLEDPLPSCPFVEAVQRASSDVVLTSFTPSMVPTDQSPIARSSLRDH